MQRKEKEKKMKRTNEINAAKKRNYVIEKLKRRKKAVLQNSNERYIHI